MLQPPREREAFFKAQIFLKVPPPEILTAWMWKCSCQKALSCFRCAHKYGDSRSHPCKMPSRAPSEQTLLWNLSSPCFWLFFTHHLDFYPNQVSALLSEAEPRGPHHADSTPLWLQGCWVVVVQSLSCVWLFVTPRTAACQASLSFTISQSLLRLLSIGSVMLYNCLILCHPLLLLLRNGRPREQCRRIPQRLFSVYSFHQGPCSEVSVLSTPQKYSSSPLTPLDPRGSNSPLLLVLGILASPTGPFSQAHISVSRHLTNHIYMTYTISSMLHVLGSLETTLPFLHWARPVISPHKHFILHPALPALPQISHPYLHPPTPSLGMPFCSWHIPPKKYLYFVYRVFLLVLFVFQFSVPSSSVRISLGSVFNAQCGILKYTLFITHDQSMCASASEIRSGIFGPFLSSSPG